MQVLIFCSRLYKISVFRDFEAVELARIPFLLALYLSLPTSPFRGRKNEYSAQRG